MRHMPFTIALVSAFSAGAADDFAQWHNAGKWDEFGGAALKADQSRLLLATPGKGVLNNGRAGKCPSIVTKRGDHQDVEIHVEVGDRQ